VHSQITSLRSISRCRSIAGFGVIWRSGPNVPEHHPCKREVLRPPGLANTIWRWSAAVSFAARATHRCRFGRLREDEIRMGA